MSHDNLELIRRVYDRFNTSGAEGLRELLDCDIVFKEPRSNKARPSFMASKAIEGFGKWAEIWESHTIEPERLVDLGDRVLALEHQRLRGRDGMGVEAHAGNTWTLR